MFTEQTWPHQRLGLLYRGKWRRSLENWNLSLVAVAFFSSGTLTTTCSESGQRPTSTVSPTVTTLVVMQGMLLMALILETTPVTNSTHPTTACSSALLTETTTDMTETVLSRTARAGGWTDVTLHIWTENTTRVRPSGLDYLNYPFRTNFVKRGCEQGLSHLMQMALWPTSV